MSDDHKVTPREQHALNLARDHEKDLGAMRKWAPEASDGELLAKWRERKANRLEQVNSSDLYAGSDMYYYCRTCGHLSDVLAESDFSTRITLECPVCSEIKKRGLEAA